MDVKLPLFDTHAHYDDEKFDEDRDALLAQFAGTNVNLILNPATSVESAFRCIELSGRYPYLYAAAGVHPHEASHMAQGDLEKIFDLCKHKKVKAVGEIGLDYYYDFSPREAQKKQFRAQMELADSLKLPVIIHDREAHEDCLEIVKEFKNVRGVYHCYSGSLEQAKVLLSLGYMLSFTGAITFKNARKAPEIIRYLPMDSIMIETDSPYMTPEPYRGKRNNSFYVEYVLKKIAETKEIALEEAAWQTYQNGCRFFNISEEERRAAHQ